jgi:predicted TIM-barrel enzyme
VTELAERLFDAVRGQAKFGPITLDENDGRTTLTVLVDHVSKEHRDAVIASGMEAGMQDAYDLLEEVANSLT